jgi:hypothetical protein
MGKRIVRKKLESTKARLGYTKAGGVLLAEGLALPYGPGPEAKQRRPAWCS